MATAYKHKIYTTLGTAEKVESDAVVVVTNSSGVPARNCSILGKSIVWNQLLDKSKYPATTTVNGVTFTNNGDGTITANGTATRDVWFNIILETTSSLRIGHKMLLIGCPSDGGWPRYLMRLSNSNDDMGNGKIFSANLENLISRIFIKSGYTATNLKFVPQLFDLTKMFGAGNEPSTPEEFRAMFPDDCYPYNAGELKTIVPTSIEASSPIRFNLLDISKFTEKVNTIMAGITAKLDQDKSIYVTGTAAGDGGRNSWGLHVNLIATHKYYAAQIVDDMNGPYLSMIGQPSKYFAGQFITCDLSGQYNFGYNVRAGVTYDRHIYPMIVDLTEMYGAGNEPITASDIPSFYDYNPDAYKRVNIPSSKYFPDGMRSAGSVQDEMQNDGAIKRIGSVDLGTLNWTYDGVGDNRYFATSGISDIRKISGGSEIPGLLNVIYPAFAQSNWYLNRPCMFKIAGNTSSFCISDPAYTDAATFKAAMSGVMLYYELDTPVSTAISPPLQSLPTYRGFNSFSAPNSLTQNGPLSVTYYAEGGSNPESGWLTSYKRKLYMGRNIEWNQLFTNSATSSNGVTISQNQDGTMILNGTANRSYINFTNLSDAMNQVHKYLLCLKILNNPDSVSFAYGWFNRNGMRTDIISNGESCTICNQTETLIQREKGAGLSGFAAETVFNNVKIAVMVMDLTQMFGAGNEPSTPEEFWSYFDHKLYPYNPGETQPLFKISRKSQWGSMPKHYTARWDKVNAAMVRLNDAASFPTAITNFAHRGSVNANYSNPFDSIYPWAGIKLCNISIDLYRNLAAGDSVTKCVTAWEGDVDFSYNDANGVWRYRPEFWGKSWEDDTYRYFDVSEKAIGSYVHYPEAIVGRWHGRTATLTIGEAEKTCLVPSVGLPATRIAMSTLHTYAKNYGATVDSIFSIDADSLLCIVEFATMNTQNAIGSGVSNLYRQSSDLIQEDATNSTVVKVLASAGNGCCIPGAIFDIGTSNGGNQVGTYKVISATTNIGDAQYLDVTLDRETTVTGANYWSVHGLANTADEDIGSKSGYIGTNGKCNAYYRGIVMFGNMWFYILGAYENKDDHHIWIANSDEEADGYDALNTAVHHDTGIVLPTAGGYTKKLGLLSRSGLLSIPAFCVETGGDSSNPVGDYFYNGSYTYNTVLLRGGSATLGSGDGAFSGNWDNAAAFGYWGFSARPRLKKP